MEKAKSVQTLSAQHTNGCLHCQIEEIRRWHLGAIIFKDSSQFFECTRAKKNLDLLHYPGLSFLPFLKTVFYLV